MNSKQDTTFSDDKKFCTVSFYYPPVSGHVTFERETFAYLGLSDSEIEEQLIGISDTFRKMASHIHMLKAQKEYEEKYGR